MGVHVLTLTKVHLFCFEEVIKGEGKEIPDVVKRWVEQYERNQKSAMAELLTMLFEVIIYCVLLKLLLLDFITLYCYFCVLSWAGMRSKISSSRRGYR